MRTWWHLSRSANWGAYSVLIFANIFQKVLSGSWRHFFVFGHLITTQPTPSRHAAQRRDSGAAAGGVRRVSGREADAQRRAFVASAASVRRVSGGRADVGRLADVASAAAGRTSGGWRSVGGRGGSGRSAVGRQALGGAGAARWRAVALRWWRAGHCALCVWCRCARRSAFSRPVLGSHGGAGAFGRGGAPFSSGRRRGACAPCVCPLPAVLAPPAAQCSAPVRSRTPARSALARKALPPWAASGYGVRLLHRLLHRPRTPPDRAASVAKSTKSTRRVLFFASIFGRINLFCYICSV